MMTKKQWCALFFLYIMFLFLGAGIFYVIESEEEQEKLDNAKIQRLEILELIYNNYRPQNITSDLLDKIADWSGRSMYEEPAMKWDFYHSFFFSVTVVTTVGYGNIAPTVSLSRIIMIFYAIVGIPLNVILLSTLGEYFSQTFVNVYKKWKEKYPKHKPFHIGLWGQIALLLFPGLLFFIFLPAWVIMIFEKWDYVAAVYYSFVTLTTIGFGDIVATFQDWGFGPWFTVYRIAVIIWIIFGLGYLIMIFGFINRGLMSKRVKRLERRIESNLKSTNLKFWSGFNRDVLNFRRVFNEVSMLRFKPVYRDDVPVPQTIRERSSSCPDLELYREYSPQFERRRAYSASEEPYVETKPIGRVQSDTDLERIDRKATFATSAMLQPCDVLARVVTALGTYQQEQEQKGSSSEHLGVGNFVTDREILASEKWKNSSWTIGEERFVNNLDVPKPPYRNRAFSAYTITVPDKLSNGVDWSGPYGSKDLESLRRNTEKPRLSIFGKLNPFKRSSVTKESDINMSGELYPGDDRRNDNTRTSRMSILSNNPDSVLENTTVGDLLRAISLLHDNVDSSNNSLTRRQGSQTPTNLPSLLTLFPPDLSQPRKNSLRAMPSGSRRMSLHPSMSGSNRSSRRYTINPMDAAANAAAAANQPTSQLMPDIRPRRHSLFPTNTSSAATSAAQFRQGLLREAVSGARRTRHDSLNEISKNTQ